MKGVHLGIDVGSTTVKLVVLDEERSLLTQRCVRANGRPRETVLAVSRVLDDRFPGIPILTVGLSGSGGGPVAKLIGGLHVNELVAQTRSVGIHYPQVRTIIELGGQDSKFLSVRWDEASGQMVLADFAMNALCAAGTGSFLDQQAERLGISIDQDFARIALESTNPARIAGRCTVFAKSDMIHQQQQGTPLCDILAGLCLALARNFRSVIARGKPFTPPILFQGGVSHNGAVARAFEEVLGLGRGQLLIPELPDHMAALGTAYVAMDEARAGRLYEFHGFGALEESVRSGEHDDRTLPMLPARPPRRPPATAYLPAPGEDPLPVYVGVDVGSISTNVVLIDDQNRVVARRYLPTAGRPIEAARQGLQEVGEVVGDRVRAVAVGATGSGRHLTGHYVGADVVRNEITAQARAAAALDPDVDTVLEIGGQDSKFIRLQNGAVVDFAMNNACAAGTGSFLEEQADRLKISIQGDFARLGLSAPTPACLGERCTVFMESDLVHHQQRGVAIPDLTAGLAYSIAENYLNRVVNPRPMGKRIFFQGGVAGNDAVAAAFEAILGREVRVPPQHDVTGAIGAAILAREEAARHPELPTRFRGFDARDRRYESETFVCKACPNLCEVKRIVVEDEPPIFYGARCDKFEEAGRGPGSLEREIPDLFAERAELVLGGYQDPGPRTSDRLRVGIPRSLVFHELFPFWRAFFEALDMDVVLSEETNPPVVAMTQQYSAADTCFPVRLVFGHVLDLVKRDVDFVFLPSIVDREDAMPGQSHNHYCPLIAASPHMVTAHIDIESMGPRVLKVPFHMGRPKAWPRETRALARQLGVPARRALDAARAGWAALEGFKSALRERGEEILARLDRTRPAAVLVGRVYNTCDAGVCQDLPRKLRRLGVLPIPMDYLPVADIDLTDAHQDMYWRSGQRILGAGKVIRGDDRLQAIYLTNFACGPDSFVISYFRRVMGEKPFLELEVDDHTAEAGIVTRCEAFFDSLNLGTGGA